jgi:hypothetical protein
MTAIELLRRRAGDYDLLAAWHAERAADDPRMGVAANACVVIAIVLHEIAIAFDDDDSDGAE